MEVSGQLHAPAALLSRKEPQVSIGQEARWAPKTNYFVKMLLKLWSKTITYTALTI
jgi:hypothetical protein